MAQVGTSSSDGGTTSLGDVARQTRKDNSGHAGKVYTNDDLPKKGGVSVVGSTNPVTPAKDPEPDAKRNQAEWRSALTQQKQRITELEGELTTAENNQARSAHRLTIGPNPRYEEYANEVESLKQQLADAKQQLTDMQEAARKAGVAHADE